MTPPIRQDNCRVKIDAGGTLVHLMHKENAVGASAGS